MTKQNESQTHKKQTQEKQLTQYALGLHDFFQTNIWNGRPSFHNRDHITAVMSAADILVKSAIQGSDTLGLLNELKLWNQNHSTIYSLDDLKRIIELAFAFHDTGNIAVLKNGQINFFDGYTAKGAEQRCCQILKHALKTLVNIQASDYELACHIIEQTIFNVTSPAKPFSYFVRICDQIGGNVFSHNNQKIQGLLLELIGEDANAQHNPHQIANFVYNRTNDLMTKEQTQRVFKAWGKTPPKKRHGFLNEQMPVSKILNEMAAGNLQFEQ